MSIHTLYLCYFGLLEPLVQTQVLPYLREVNKLRGIQVSLVTFEPNFTKAWNAEQIKSQKQRLAAEGINWHVLPYHKSPSVPATLYDIFCGAKLASKLIKEKDIDILHARVHVPALMGAIAKKLSRRNVKLVFDIRGFFPEEYTDAGNWKENGLIYRSVKRVEKWLFKMSDGFIVLTEKARMILFPESVNTGSDRLGRPVEVIPCCVDLRRFENIELASVESIRNQMGLNDRRVFTYIGSLGTWYLADEMADLLKTAREHDRSVFAMVLTQSDPKAMSEKLRSRGFSENDFVVKRVVHTDVPTYLAVANVAISFIKPCYSKLSSSPTKIAEYLASGIPIVTNRGVGDVAEQIEADSVGAVIEEFSAESYNQALCLIEDLAKDANLSSRCRKSAKDRFDLESVGGEKYRDFYRRLIVSGD